MIKLTTDSGQTIVLNPEQEDALAAMDAWWQTDERYYLLSAPAGCGKSTIVKHFLGVVEVVYGCRSIVVAAPTHKAKGVIERLSGYEGFTLQRLLGLAPDVSLAEFDPEKPEFAQKRKSTLQDYKLVVLDEVSMVNKKLFEYIHKTMAPDGKLLMMADFYQLPPIGEKISPIAESELVTTRSTLTKVERQADGNPLLLMFDAIREKIDSRSATYKREDALDHSGTNGVRFIQARPFALSMIEAFTSPEYREDSNHAKVLCWTNDMVKYWNTGLRSQLMKAWFPNETYLYPIMPGEVLMAYSGYEGKLQNSADYVVERIQQDAEYEFPYPNGAGGQHICKLKTYGVWMQDTDGQPTFVHVLNQDDQQNIREYLKAYWAFIGDAKKNRKWPEFFKFRSLVMLMQKIEISNDGKFAITKDLDYGYAITCHRAQGSTYQNVFIDEVDIMKNRDHVERNKLMYVALSRPRKMAYVRLT